MAPNTKKWTPQTGPVKQPTKPPGCDDIIEAPKPEPIPYHSVQPGEFALGLAEGEKPPILTKPKVPCYRATSLSVNARQLGSKDRGMVEIPEVMTLERDPVRERTAGDTPPVAAPSTAEPPEVAKRRQHRRVLAGSKRRDALASYMEVSAAAGVASLREAQDLVLAEACAGGEVDKRMQHRAVLAGALKADELVREASAPCRLEETLEHVPLDPVDKRNQHRAVLAGMVHNHQLKLSNPVVKRLSEGAGHNSAVPISVSAEGTKPHGGYKVTSAENRSQEDSSYETKEGGAVEEEEDEDEEGMPEGMTIQQAQQAALEKAWQEYMEDQEQHRKRLTDRLVGGLAGALGAWAIVSMARNF